ncbi:MAG: pyridoxamine 5'-phosphate oxidase family protein [Cyclobacteriaceae bacterium]|nr:pyridoxamine 5'-phosphate oxidase family protein [Cyclobacteriaceae bacterium]
MQYPQTPLNTVKRGAKKAAYDKATVHAILDATEICHVAFSIEGRPHVQPINFGREGEKLYMHGSLNNRMTNALIEAGEICLSVSILDAMKITRSAYHHSVNFRSVVVFGKVRELTANEEKLMGLKALINHFVPDRWDHCRPPNDNELKATRIIEITIETASAKIADRPSQEEKKDYELDYWAGIIPVRTNYGDPLPDEKLREGTEVPEHIMDFYKRKNRDV